MANKDEFDIEFTKDGSIFDERQVQALLQNIGGSSDLVVICHGWNNNRDEAAQLYDRFRKSIEGVVKAGTVPGSAPLKLTYARLFWPSKKFEDRDLIPGGGVASAKPANDAALLKLLEELKRDPVRLGGNDVDAQHAKLIDRAKKLVPALDTVAGQQEFVQCLRSVLNRTDEHPEDGSREFFAADASRMFEEHSEPVNLPVFVAGGGATSVDAGGAAGFFGDLFDGVQAGARRLVNFATYYQMKSRAGSVGRDGLSNVLRRVRETKPQLPLHLVGHSFGARVVTAAASTLPVHSKRVSLSLLQAAFSHNGFSNSFDADHNAGAFRSVLGEKRVSGPVLITHTKNDHAVGIAYPIASRLARDAAAALGDEHDPYGGLGRNGAQRTPEADEDTLKEVGQRYNFSENRVFNLRADSFVKNHSDVTGFEIAQAFLNSVCIERRA
jgi:hypothetical protein